MVKLKDRYYSIIENDRKEKQIKRHSQQYLKELNNSYLKLAELTYKSGISAETFNKLWIKIIC